MGLGNPVADRIHIYVNINIYIRGKSVKRFGI